MRKSPIKQGEARAIASRLTPLTEPYVRASYTAPAEIMNDLNLKIMELQRRKEAPETRSAPETPEGRENGKAHEKAEEDEPVP